MALEATCDRCGMSFPEDALIFDGNVTICKWCYREKMREKFEMEDKLSWDSINEFISDMDKLKDFCEDEH